MKFIFHVILVSVSSHWNSMKHLLCISIAIPRITHFWLVSYFVIRDRVVVMTRVGTDRCSASIWEQINRDNIVSEIIVKI